MTEHGFTMMVSTIHNDLAVALAPHRGEHLYNGQVMDIYAARFGPKRRNHIIAADHCDNHRNKGACRCAQSKLALLHICAGHKSPSGHNC
jgi:hypothetical protein